jgi:hypothetical protein
VYAKLFTSIYQGTLRGDSHGLLVFTNLIAHADSAGHVDIHPRAIADEVGLSLEQVRAALLKLEAPDEESRSPELEGRRIVRLNEHRDWGWQVVNYLKYRAIRDEEDRREQNRLAQQRWRERKNGTSTVSEVSSVSRDKPIQKQKQKQDTEAETKTHTPGASAGTAGFALFWAAYPRKTARAQALKAFEKLAPSTDLLDEIIVAVQQQCTWADWRRDDGRYIPHAATWLNARRWEDEKPAELSPHDSPEPTWKREQRERYEAFTGRDKRKETIDMENGNETARIVG